MQLPNTACIMVGSNGFVWYATSVMVDGDMIHMNKAQIIRQWGTEKGLAELIKGPTPTTVLDTESDVVLHKAAFLFAIPCTTWKK